MASPENEQAVRQAMAAAEKNAQVRQAYYQAQAGVPVGTAGVDPAPLPIPVDRPEITGVIHPAPGGGAA
jgi:hypothetical protein